MHFELFILDKISFSAAIKLVIIHVCYIEMKVI